MLKELQKSTAHSYKAINKGFKVQIKKLSAAIDKKPFLSFFLALGLLLSLIIASNILGTPKKIEKADIVQTKSVSVYQIGSAPKLIVQAQIKKSGVIRITALTGGVVQQVYKNEEERFYRGQTLVGLSSNYQGGNIPSLSRKLAQAQRDFTLSTLQPQKDLISKQKELSEELNDQSGETDVSKLQEDVTKKQLDLQDKSLDLNREIQELQVQINQVSEASMYPSAPFAGVVDNVLVKVGQSVNPGQVLMQISEDVEADPVTAVAYVSADIAKRVSRIEPTVVTIGKDKIKLYPFHISQDAVAGRLYAVYFDVPELYRAQVTENGSVTVELPIGSSDSSGIVPFVPIDTVYQTKEADFLFVIEKGRSMPRRVKLGSVFGTYVQVLSGLKDGDEVITDRNVIAGDLVKKIN